MLKWMMQDGLKLCWHWCIPHMSNAATMVADATKSKNPQMTDLIHRIVETIYTVKHVEVMGSLFEELCRFGRSGRTPHQLLDYRAHRFLGLTRVIKRILDLWEHLVTWFAEHLDKARREQTSLPPGFPLERDYQNLVQILSLLQPITVLNVKSQGESANQVDALVILYKLRLPVLDCTKELRDYRFSRTEPMAYRPEDLTSLAITTRKLLHDAFHARYFSRYTDRKEMNNCSFILEMQLFLHPNFKSFDGFLKRIVLLCNADNTSTTAATGDRHFAKIKKKNYEKIRSMMLAVAVIHQAHTTTTTAISEEEPPPLSTSIFSEDLMDLFGDVIDPGRYDVQEAPDVNETRIDEELERWETSATSIQTNGKRPETILEYWKRQSDSGAYKFLPLVVRILFATPTSAQIERDFGTAGQLVTSQRGSIAPHSVDMSTFLNCNRVYVDITQCPKISTREIDLHIPSSVKVGLEDGDAEGCELMSGYFSGDSDFDADGELDA